MSEIAHLHRDGTWSSTEALSYSDNVRITFVQLSEGDFAIIEYSAASVHQNRLN